MKQRVTGREKPFSFSNQLLHFSLDTICLRVERERERACTRSSPVAQDYILPGCKGARDGRLYDPLPVTFSIATRIAEETKRNFLFPLLKWDIPFPIREATRFFKLKRERERERERWRFDDDTQNAGMMDGCGKEIWNVWEGIS